MIQNNFDVEKLELRIKRTSKKVLKRDLYKNRAVTYCPYCSSQRYIKFGFFDKIQRYRCKDCKKTFSKATNSLCFYSKKDTKTWLKFIELFTEKKSLRFCAKKLKISLVTAFYWRHKILYALTLNSTPDDLKGVVHIAKTIVKESFKGKKNLRLIHPNLENERKDIWIIAAKGIDDSMFVNPVLENGWNNKIFNEMVYSKIEKKSYIVPYGDRYLKLVAIKHNKKRKLETVCEDKIRFIHHNIRKWFSDYHGVASKYLKRYLSFFVLFNLDKVYNSIDLMYCDLIHGQKYIKTNLISHIETIVCPNQSALNN